MYYCSILYNIPYVNWLCVCVCGLVRNCLSKNVIYLPIILNSNLFDHMWKGVIVSILVCINNIRLWMLQLHWHLLQNCWHNRRPESYILIVILIYIKIGEKINNSTISLSQVYHQITYKERVLNYTGISYSGCIPEL